MIHKAYQILGEKTIIERPTKTDTGIFYKSQFDTKGKCACCDKIIEIIPEKALDFLIQLYGPLPQNIERISMGIIPRPRINPGNPVLHLWMGVDL